MPKQLAPSPRISSRSSPERGGALPKQQAPSPRTSCRPSLESGVMPKSPRPSPRPCLEGRLRSPPGSARRHSSPEQLLEKVCSLEASKRSADLQKRQEKIQRQRALSEVKKRINQEILTASKDMRKSESVAMKMESQIAHLEKQEQQFGTWKARQMEYLDGRISKLRSSQNALEDALQEQAMTMGEARGRLEHARMAAQMLEKGLDMAAVAGDKPVSGLELVAAKLAAREAADDVGEDASGTLDAERMNKLVEKLLVENMLVHEENKGLQERLEREALRPKHWSLEVEVEELEASTDAGPDSSISPSSPSELSSEPCSSRPGSMCTQVDCVQTRPSARVNPPKDWSVACSVAEGLADSRWDTGGSSVKIGATREDPATVNSDDAPPAASKRGATSRDFPAGAVIYSGKAAPRHEPPSRCASQTPRLGRRDSTSQTPRLGFRECCSCISPKAASRITDVAPPKRPLSVQASPRGCRRAPLLVHSRPAGVSSVPQAVPVHSQSEAARGRSRSPSAQRLLRSQPTVILPQASVVNVRMLSSANLASQASVATTLPGERHPAIAQRTAVPAKPPATPRAALRSEVTSEVRLSSKSGGGSYCTSARVLHGAEPSSSATLSADRRCSGDEADIAEAGFVDADTLRSKVHSIENSEANGDVESSKTAPGLKKRRNSFSSVVHKLTARALQEYREAHINDP